MIRNCTILNGNLGGWYGIYLQNVTNGRIENNTIIYNHHGIYMYNSSYNTFINNNFSNSNATSGYGMYVYYRSDNNVFINNTCNNNRDGIVIWNSSYNTLTNNICSNNSQSVGSGIFLLENASHNTLENNTCVYNAYGIRLQNSNDNTLTGNILLPNYQYGIFISSSNDNTVINNPLNSFKSESSSGNSITATDPSSNLSASFECGGNIDVSWTNDPSSGAQTLGSLGMYIMITASNNPWVFLNVSYAGVELTAQEASSLAIYRWNGTDWELPITGEGGYGVNTVNKYVYANITQFSTFAPLYSPESHPAPVGGIIIPVESVPVPPAVPLAAAVVVAMAVAAVLAAVALMRPWRRLLR